MWKQKNKLHTLVAQHESSNAKDFFLFFFLLVLKLISCSSGCLDLSVVICKWSSGVRFNSCCIFISTVTCSCWHSLKWELVKQSMFMKAFFWINIKIWRLICFFYYSLFYTQFLQTYVESPRAVNYTAEDMQRLQARQVEAFPYYIYCIGVWSEKIMMLKLNDTLQVFCNIISHL